MKRKTMRRYTTLVGTLLVAVLALSGTALAVTTPLAVTKTVPAGGATEVSRTANVKAYFNHDMNASTITSSTFKIRKQGTTTWFSATRTVNNAVSPTSTNGGSQSVATLDPDANLSANTTYQVLVVGGSSGVKDLNGNALGANKSWTFTTATPPQTTIDPNIGPTGTVASTSASFAFSSSKPNSTFKCSLDGSAFAACTSPKDYLGPLSQGSHTFRVRAIDATGTPDPTPASRTWTVDTTAPTVTGVSPADAATGVASTTNVTVTFSEAMNSSSISSQTFTLKQQGSTSQLGAAVSYDSTTRKATLDPSTDLAPNTTYTATLTTGVKDAAGNTLAQELSWTFTTGIAGPTVVSYAPTGSPQAPGLSTNVTATFSTAMAPSTITTSTFTLTPTGSSVPLAAQVTYDSTSKTATLDPSANLSDSTNYTAVIKGGSDGVKDLQGNSLAQDFSWTFMACDGGIVLSTQSITPMGLTICG